MKYFVTGATGFVGGRVVRLLIKDGHEVNAVVRNPGKARYFADLGIRLFKGDVSDKESMREPMRGADGVFHIAGWYKVGTRDKSQGRITNIDGTRNVLELMKELSIPRGVYTSTLAVNSDTRGVLADEAYRFTGKHLSEYDRTKAEAHRLADNFIREGLPLIIVMPGLIYGPGDTSSVRPALIDYLRKRLPMIPKRTAFCWAHVDDIAAAHILAMTKGNPGGTYIIAGPRHTFSEAMDIAKDITGIRKPMLGPVWMLKIMAAVMYALDRIIPVPESYTGEGLRVIAGVTYIGDNSKARSELGYNPRPLRDGLRETLEHEMKLLRMG